MRITSFSAASLAVIVAMSAGCSSAPSPIDLTPRFVAGESRTECLESYAAIRSRVADVHGNVGFSWQAKVLSVGPEGATIDAQMNRVVCKLPGLPAFDSDGVIPVGLTSVGELILKMVGVKFQYTVSPTGEVNVTGWQSALTEASKATGVPIPGDGSVPTEDMVEEALRRVYGIPMPRRQVVLDETWTASGSYHLGNPEQGPRITSTETFTYEGFGELKVPFGGRTEVVDGLGVQIKSTPNVTSVGNWYMGKIDVQTGRSGGFLCVNLQGDEILGYWEKSTFSVEPREGLMPGPVDLLGGALKVASKLVDLECGWVFFAGSPWK
jgi:hypothetical protein